MFDNPKKELQRLEDELLAAEEEEWSGQWEQEPPDQEPPEFPELQQEEADDPEEADPSPKPNRTPMLIALLLIEIGVLFAALAWWLLWR